MYIKLSSDKKTRELKKIIFAMLWKKLALKIEKINYVKSYFVLEWKMKSKNEQIFYIYFEEEKKEALLTFLKSNFWENNYIEL